MEAATAPPTLRRVVDLLGGRKTLKSLPHTPIDAHELLARGLPGKALTYLVESFMLLQKPQALEKAVGVSLRTLQRRRIEPAKRLTSQQSARTWKFAEIVAKATEVLGSKDAAEAWLETPAIGLDQRRPIDLLSTPAGVEILETHLERLKYGVYA